MADLIRFMHYGEITHNDKRVATAVAPTKQRVIYELNSWFFDYFYANDLTVQQLPAIDDWSRSDEDVRCEYVTFPAEGWLVSINYVDLKLDV